MRMQFDSFCDALFMDGHGFYVWLAVGTSVFIMMAMVLVPIWFHKLFINNLKMHSPNVIESQRQDEAE